MRFILFISLILFVACNSQRKMSARNWEILVDETAYDRKGLIYQINDIRDTLYQIAQSEKRKSLLGAKISLTKINDRGLNAPDWVVQIPEKQGLFANDFKKQLKLVLKNLDQTIKELGTAHKTYKSSLLLPTIANSLSNNDLKKIIIISDFAIVSGKLNFERSSFADAPIIKYKKIFSKANATIPIVTSS